MCAEVGTGRNVKAILLAELYPRDTFREGSQGKQEAHVETTEGLSADGCLSRRVNS